MSLLSKKMVKFSFHQKNFFCVIKHYHSPTNHNTYQSWRGTLKRDFWLFWTVWMAFILAAASTLALIFWPCRLFGKYGFIVRYPENCNRNLNPTLVWNFLAILEVDDRRQSFLISFWVGKEANLGRNCGAKNGHYSRLNCPSGDKRSFKGRWFLCSFRFWRLVVVRRTPLVCDMKLPF